LQVKKDGIEKQNEEFHPMLKQIDRYQQMLDTNFFQMIGSYHKDGDGSTTSEDNTLNNDFSKLQGNAYVNEDD